VDNGSAGKESQDFLESIKNDVKLIRRDSSEEGGLYWSPAANKGVQVTDSKYLIFLHCDVVILNPSWIDLLTEHADKFGMVGVEFGSYYTQNDYIQEWCVLMTRDCWNDVGPFPVELPQIGMSFIMTMWAQQKGYNPQVMQKPICYHYHISSLELNQFEMLHEQSMVLIPELMRQNENIFKRP
jgi:hypothetical protein